LRTGQPFWLARDGLPYTYPSLKASTSADVVVVGGGITGACMALELSRIGASVVVIDRRDAASASSAASTGLLLYDTDTSLAELSRILGDRRAVRVYELGLEAITWIDDFRRSAGHDCGFQQRPSLYLASARSDVSQLAEEFHRREENGFDVDWLDRSALEARYGFRRPAAIRARGTAEVDPYRLTHEILHAAAGQGARVFDRTAATSIARRGDRAIVRTNRGPSITTNAIVWATGYESFHEAPSQAHLVSTWVLTTEPLEDFGPWSDRCLIWETARPYLYLRSTDDGRMMVGGEDERCAECHRSATWFNRKIRRLLQNAQQLFPSLPLEIRFAWAGTFSMVDDGLPIITRVGSRPEEWLALGYGGNGITFSVIAARLIAAALAGRPAPELAMFGADRSEPADQRPRGNRKIWTD
jgi:glycine/D-amino acid oxidase-like deaminating enzyme